MSKQSHCKKIIEYCEKNGWITAAEAVTYLGCYRLAARIADLEAAGRQFDHTMVYTRKVDGTPLRYMKYRLVS